MDVTGTIFFFYLILINNKMNHYKLIARSDDSLYLDVRGILISIKLKETPSFIGNNFYDLPYVDGKEEAKCFLDRFSGIN